MPQIIKKQNIYFKHVVNYFTRVYIVIKIEIPENRVGIREFRWALFVVRLKLQYICQAIKISIVILKKGSAVSKQKQLKMLF